MVFIVSYSLQTAFEMIFLKVWKESLKCSIASLSFHHLNSFSLAPKPVFNATHVFRFKTAPSVWNCESTSKTTACNQHNWQKCCIKIVKSHEICSLIFFYAVKHQGLNDCTWNESLPTCAVFDPKHSCNYSPVHLHVCVRMKGFCTQSMDSLGHVQLSARWQNVAAPVCMLVHSPS